MEKYSHIPIATLHVDRKKNTYSFSLLFVINLNIYPDCVHVLYFQFSKVRILDLSCNHISTIDNLQCCTVSCDTLYFVTETQNISHK